MAKKSAQQSLIELFPREIERPVGWNCRKESTSPTDADERSEKEDWPDDKLEESLRARWVIQPVRVRRTVGGAYYLVCGWRRVAMCEKIDPGRKVPCIIMPTSGDEKADDYDARLENVVENLHRVNIKPWELAEAFTQIKSVCGKSASEIARGVGLSESHVQNLIRMRRDLCEELWDAYKTNASGMRVEDLIRVCAQPRDEQVDLYNSITLLRKGGRPVGATSGAKPPRRGTPAEHKHINAWYKQARAVKAETPEGAAFIRGIVYAFACAVGDDRWNIESAVTLEAKKEGKPTP